MSEPIVKWGKDGKAYEFFRVVNYADDFGPDTIYYFEPDTGWRNNTSGYIKRRSDLDLPPRPDQD